MIELILGTYGGLCWLLFKKFKVIPTNTYTVCTAILGGGVILLMLAILLAIFHPVSPDGRFYTATVPIVPEVRGLVIEVPVVANVPVNKGDVLFRIDPRTYEIEVQRLEASLAAENSNVAQLEQKLTGAEAAQRKAEENVRVSESENDRQVREALERATAQVSETQARLQFSRTQMERRSELVAKGVISREEFDRGKAQLGTLEAELRQAQATQREADEKLKAGGSRTQSIMAELNRAEAEANQVRLELKSESGGVNPKVRQTMAELDLKRWELEHSVVRAPSAGFATQVALRPGQMATPLAARPVMVFVPRERPTLVASFSQTVIPELEEGLEAELAFKSHPGRVFKAKVSRIVPIIPEGEFLVSGQLRSVTSSTAPGRVAVVFEYGEDVAALDMPIGAQAMVAIYTHKAHALSILRKIILRIKSWENYLFFIGH